MLQQTTVAAVASYFADFTTRWPGVGDLAAASQDEVLQRWAGLGYYARARNLHAAARTVAGELGGVFPGDSAALMGIKGIGPYTSAAIAAICFDERIAVVDGNVERVAARLSGLADPVRDAKDAIRTLVQSAVPERSGDFAQAMMDLGATVCTPRRPGCTICPLRAECVAFNTGEPTRFPVRAAKAGRPVRRGHAYVMARSDGAILLRRRPESGLLGGMMEVPGSLWGAECDPDLPDPGDFRKAGSVTHVFTHFRLELTVWRADKVDDGAASSLGGFWVPNSTLGESALPTLFRKVLASAGV